MQSPPAQLFRFSQYRHIDGLRRFGKVRFAHARTFADTTLTQAQRDNEQSRNFSPDPRAHQIIVAKPDGSFALLVNVINIPLTFNLVGKTGRHLDYYILCFSLEYDENGKNKFGDTCLRITNPQVFFERLMVVCRRQSLKSDFYARDVCYYDSVKLPASIEQPDLVFMKSEKYADQKEFRLIFTIDPALSESDYLYFEAGSMEDVSELYYH